MYMYLDYQIVILVNHNFLNQGWMFYLNNNYAVLLSTKKMIQYYKCNCYSVHSENLHAK